VADAHRTSVLVVEVYLLVTAVDVLLAWVQPDARRFPRRLTHWVTEPVQRLFRPLAQRLPVAGWDVSPILVVAVLGFVRVWLVRP
jgi:uncharacterized protein YggT (Ycf19 family)